MNSTYGINWPPQNKFHKNRYTLFFLFVFCRGYIKKQFPWEWFLIYSPKSPKKLNKILYKAQEYFSITYLYEAQEHFSISNLLRFWGFDKISFWQENLYSWDFSILWFTIKIFRGLRQYFPIACHITLPFFFFFLFQNARDLFFLSPHTYKVANNVLTSQRTYLLPCFP